MPKLSPVVAVGVQVWGKLASLRTSSNSRVGMQENGMVRINKCHDFAWSRTLWRKASLRIGMVSFLLFGVYLWLGYYFLGYKSGLSAVDSWYLLSATMTTVGCCSSFFLLLASFIAMWLAVL